VSITTLRTELAELVGAATGFKPSAFLPSKFQAKSVYVTPPAGRWITPAERFGYFNVTFEVSLLLSGLNNQTGTEAANDAVEEALVALVNGGWGVESADVEPLTSDGATYLGVVITVTNSISF
jgi:hypothetical protein